MPTNSSDPVSVSLPGPPRPLRLFVFSHPRTASNLFCKLFSEHPALDYREYPFLFAYFSGPDAQSLRDEGSDPSPEIVKAQKAMVEMMKDATYQSILDKVERDITESEVQNKIPVFKDHTIHLTQSTVVKSLLDRPRGLPPKPKMEDNLLDVPEAIRSQFNHVPYYDHSAPLQNPLIFPDRLLKTFAPIFIIRHPAKQVGSYYKASRISNDSVDSSEFELDSSYKFSRLLFDYYRHLYRVDGASEDRTKWPIVVDGDDLINDTEGVALRFCAITGLDASGVIYKWDKTVTSNPFEAVFKGTLNASNGVLKNESAVRPSIAKETERWEHEWGYEVSQKLARLAEMAMEDYLYLYRYSL